VQKLGKYEILMELGHGAMGVVYKARDPLIGRMVALKTINSNLVDRPDLLERFYQEAQSAGKLQHPNIVTIFELGQEKDTPFIAMEYLDGDSLEKMITRQMDMPLALRIGYIVRICQALEYAHKNRVVHRDIKPGNIMVSGDGVVKVVDFGIARLVDFSRTHTNMMIGTPAYMAPELFRKKKADERTDIWAVGVTFYELLCYQRPFNGDGYDIISSIMEDEVPSIGATLPDCPAEVESVIARMLKKASAERYQSMEDVLLDLEPVWNRLKTSEAAELAERGRELYELGDLALAHDRLRQARQIDSTNSLAKSLLEKIATQVRRSEVEPKVREHLSRGRVHLEAAQFREAQAEAEAALGLDSRHETAQKFLAEVEAGVARAQQLEQKLRLTKQRLAEGSLDEAESALRQAFELDAANTQAVDLQRQVGAERSRRERRKQVSEIVQRARTLWTELKYDECLAVLGEGLKAFPNETELKNLQETARAEQAEQTRQAQVAEVRKLLAQQKLAEARKSLEALTREQPNDSAIRNLQSLLAREEREERQRLRLAGEVTSLRSMVSAGRLSEAVKKGEALLKEFAEEPELQDLVNFARSELAQQDEKKGQREQEKRIEWLIDERRHKEAAEQARAAAQKYPNHDVFRALAERAEAKLAEQEGKEKIQREVQQRIQEIRGKIKRQELTDAIDLAQQTLATLGPDTDVTQLLQAAQVEVQQRNQKKDERTQQLTAARTLLEKADFAGARQVLDRGIATKIVSATDMQVKLLMSEIAQKESESWAEEQKRKGAGKPEKESVAGGPEATLLGQGPGTPTIAADAGSFGGTQAGARVGGKVGRMPTSAPVATPVPAPAKGEQTAQASAAGAATKATADKTGGSVRRKVLVAAAIVLVLVAGVFAAKRYVWKKQVAPVASAEVPSAPTPAAEQPAVPSAEDAALETEAEQLWADHKMDDSLADWKKLADRAGPLQNEAIQQVSDIEQKHAAAEKSFADGMRLLYEEKKYPEAAAKFDEVVRMNLWKVDAAKREYETAKKGPATPPVPRPVTPAAAAKASWEPPFEQGRAAFEKKDYAAALESMQRVLKADGVPEEISDEATQFVAMARERAEQKKDFDRAVQLQQAGQTQQAEEMFGRVIAASNGDPEIAETAKNDLAAMKPPTPPTPAPTPQPAPPVQPKPAPSAAAPQPAPVSPNSDYAAVIKDAQALVSQGQWDAADAKLATLPPNQSQALALKRVIAAGRREDQVYLQAKGFFVQAETTKNKVMLRQIRSFFVVVADKPGRHSEDAHAVLQRIDADLGNAPKAAAEANDAPHLHDAGAIRTVLDAFAKAVENGDEGALSSVARLDTKEDAKVRGLMAGFQTTGYALESCSAPEISGTTAKAHCEAIFTKVPSSKKIKAKFQLSLIDGQWFVVSWN
jgi:eukaryotic-like serine/threonine-protein kinase